ncbi:hypothetical protein GCM10009839_14670 [Catenulispora yoronensis]|uniref:PKD domain-containing protein n=1 Tax=Catenulispora yoronensis TaxID=450799 RepID=A0ABN2TS20_9ACTN
MGNHTNPSLARKRLSTLAVTTTLAAVGVGVIGTGVANAATPAGVGHTQVNPALDTAAALNSVKVTGADGLTVTADIAGTQIAEAITDYTNVHVTIDWNEDHVDPQAIDVHPNSGDAGKPASNSVAHTFKAPGTYHVTVKVDDGSGGAAKTATKDVTVFAAPTLVAAVSTKTPAPGSPVVVNLTGSSVDKSAAGATTTIKWGDTASDSVLTGDPSKILTTDAKLSHTYAAGNYTLSVQLNDGLGNANSKTDAQTFAITVGANGKIVVNRASGSDHYATGDRYTTGLVIAQRAWADNGKAATDTAHRQQAKAVVLATGVAFPDALAGGPLAKKVGGPLLLTDGGAATTNPDVLKEIQRVLPPTSATVPAASSTVYILGGEKAISTGIENELTAKGYTVKRLAGADRYETALKIAKDGMGDPSRLILARGDEGTNHNGFADALAAGPYAANVFGGAVVLSNGSTMDPATKAYVTSKLHVGAKNVGVVGGPAVAAIKTIPGSADLYSASFGNDRYETAAMLADKFPHNVTVGVATGLQFPDALTGGAYMASIGGPLLLSDPTALSDATAKKLGLIYTTTPEVDIFGGEKAVTPAVANAIATLVKVATIGKF